MEGSPRAVLVRHPRVAASWKGYCYGASDVPLSRAGRKQISKIAADLAANDPSRVVHTGLVRTLSLATAIARISKVPLHYDARFAEMNFGTWEGRSWLTIYSEIGDTMSKIIEAPDSYAPDGGETVLDVRNRVVSALLGIPRDGLTVVVTHGGPISAVRGTLAKLPVRAWPDLIPGYCERLCLLDADLDNLAKSTALHLHKES
ncbi:MAG: histidine phosphatase family protein [Hyphomicrobiaceae bacterium]